MSIYVYRRHERRMCEKQVYHFVLREDVKIILFFPCGVAPPTPNGEGAEPQFFAGIIPLREAKETCGGGEESY
jgi:hypothetical protein